MINQHFNNLFLSFLTSYIQWRKSILCMCTEGSGREEVCGQEWGLGDALTLVVSFGFALFSRRYSVTILNPFMAGSSKIGFPCCKVSTQHQKHTQTNNIMMFILCACAQGKHHNMRTRGRVITQSVHPFMCGFV